MSVDSENCEYCNPAVARGRCSGEFASMTADEILYLFQDAGLQRIRERADRLLSDMIRLGEDKAFLRRLFEAFGGKRNKDSFSTLFEKTVLKYPDSVFRDHFEALIWGESGLLPFDGTGISDPDSFEKAKALWKEWSMIRPDAAKQIGWHKSAVFPFGSPERKIAALCAFLKKYGTNPSQILYDEFSESSTPEKMVNVFRVSDPFWEQRTGFASSPMLKKAVLISKKRASVLVCDVLIPHLAACAKLQKKPEAEKKILSSAVLLPSPCSNSLIARTLQKWFPDPEKAEKEFLKNGAAMQGVLHLYNIHCRKCNEKCTECTFSPAASPE